MTGWKNGFTLTFTFKGVQCQVELRKLTLVFLSILEECAELLFADVDTATHTHRGRVWLHVNFFAHVFREENLVRMEY